jgi:PBSX family phage terminase large subunit
MKISLKLKLNNKQKIARNSILGNRNVKYICFYGASRSGKTFLTFHYFVERALNYPDSQHLFFRKTLSSLKQGLIGQTMPKYFNLISKLNGVKSLFTLTCANGKKFVSFNKHDSALTFFNGSKILFYGASQTSTDTNSLDKVLSTEWATIGIDEATENEYSVIEQLKTRLTQLCFDGEGRCIMPKMVFMLNPTTFEAWDYVLFHEKKHPISAEKIADINEYSYLHFTAIDNVDFNSPDYLKVLEGLSPRSRQRFLLGEHGANFDGEIFKQLNWIDVQNYASMERIVIYCDPSYKSGVNNDYKAIVTVGLHEGTFYVIAVRAAQCTTYDMVHMLWEAQEECRKNLVKYNIERMPTPVTYVENAGLSDDFQKCVNEYTAKYQVSMPYTLDRTRKGDKYNRIESLLVPLNEQYKLYFSNEIKETKAYNQVEVQFLNFKKNMPKNMHDDIPDAIHGAITQLSYKSTGVKASDVKSFAPKSNHIF